jgi:hypothetical protein
LASAGTFSIGQMSPAEPEWITALKQFIQKFLAGKTEDPDISFRISSKKTVNLSSWRNWETPTLSETTDQKSRHSIYGIKVGFVTNTQFITLQQR